MDGFFSEREDWMEFRTLETLGRKGGVPEGRLGQLVAKEIADNAFDAGGRITYGILSSGGFFVQDGGGGIPGNDEELAGLFSIKRPLRSTKHWRLPTRGALGNGLRIVAGLTLASGGSLTVKTRGRSLQLAPQDDGSTKVLSSESWPGDGARIEFQPGRKLRLDLETIFELVEWTDELAGVGTE
jgi:hypothetical protein